jgi:pimeloyl-ACP methyl ester carboxylesterase
MFDLRKLCGGRLAGISATAGGGIVLLHRVIRIMPRHPFNICRIALPVFLALVSMRAGAAAPQICGCVPTDPCVFGNDEVWLVSSREVDTCQDSYVDQLPTQRWLDRQWKEMEPDDLFESHDKSDKLTVVYLHGNRTDFEWAKKRGAEVYNAVFSQRPEPQSVRFVVWSWPADPNPNRVQEYRDNTRRSVFEASVLQAFLEKLRGNKPIGLIGYSFGSQAVVLAAERVCDDPEVTPPINLRIAVIAPALQKPWSGVADPFAAGSSIESEPMAIINSRDRALRAHRVISHFSHGSFACLTSVDEISPPSKRQPGIDVGRRVGRRHNVVCYINDPLVASLVRSAMLEIELDTVTSVADEAND